MEIITFGRGERLLRAAARLSHFCKSSLYTRLLLLPIPSTRDKINITSTQTPLSSLVSFANEKTLTVGYGIPDEISLLLRSAGAEVCDLSLCEEFLVKNAEITARGALGHILSSSESDVTDLKVGIIGYGRIGKALLRLLLFLGADTVVYTKRESVVRELCEMGVLCELIDGDTRFEDCSVILNTAPAKIISEDKLNRMLPRTRIVDLASGKIFPDAMGVVKLSSIPEINYPETAGRIYAEYAERALLEEKV